MEQKEFTHKDVLKIFPEVKARTLISWSERGLVTPEIEEAAGRGTRRRYSYKNLIEIGFVQELLRYKMPFSLISNLCLQLQHPIDRFGFDFVFTTYRPTEGWPDDTPMTRYIALEGLLGGRTDELLRSPIKKVNDKPVPAYLTSLILINVSAIKDKIDRRLEEI